MTAQPQPRTMDTADFLAWEAAQESRHEFVDGEIFAMTGGTLFHSIITGNLYTALRQQLEPRGCLTFAENAKLRAGRNIFYPDVVVTCDPNQLDRDLVELPILVAEVLSPSTSTYDRETKWVRCRQHLPSLQAFLLVAQDAIQVDVFRRTATGWHFSEHIDPDAALELSAPHCRLALADIYKGLLGRLAPPT